MSQWKHLSLGEKTVIPQNRIYRLDSDTKGLSVASQNAFLTDCWCPTQSSGTDSRTCTWQTDMSTAQHTDLSTTDHKLILRVDVEAHHFSQCRDNFPQRGQGFIDICSFLKKSTGRENSLNWVTGWHISVYMHSVTCGTYTFVLRCPWQCTTVAQRMAAGGNELTFSRVPLAPVESALSLPARSTKLILLTCKRQWWCSS